MITGSAGACGRPGHRARAGRTRAGPAAGASIPLPRVREFSLDDDPAWVIYDVPPGVLVPEAGDLGPGGSRFTHMAQMMGELLAAFCRLPAANLNLDELWADPQRLAAAAASWAEQLPAFGAVWVPGWSPHEPGLLETDNSAA